MPVNELRKNHGENNGLWTRPRLGNYRSGRTKPDEDMCLKLQRILADKYPPGYILAMTQAVRTQNEEASHQWREVAGELLEVWKTYGGRAASVVITLFLLVIYMNGGADFEAIGAAFIMPAFTHYAKWALEIALTLSILALWQTFTPRTIPGHHRTPADSLQPQ